MTQRNKEEDEARLFLEAMKDVKPLTHHILELTSNRPEKDPNQLSTSVAHTRSRSEEFNENSFVRSGVQVNVLRKLRRGHIPMEDELDLHGYSSREAEAKLHAFLLGARRADRQRGVRIIHGKGLGSPGGKSVLKEKTQQWLRESDAVLAFSAAGSADGGSGAVHVLLKRR